MGLSIFRRRKVKSFIAEEMERKFNRLTNRFVTLEAKLYVLEKEKANESN